jgi:DNA helicase-2/ATP-dependent DNA helicase PcrA
MVLHADLHVHSRHSRATARTCDLDNLARWAIRKGLAVIGTGDFTHPAWMEQIRTRLAPAEPGLLALRDESGARCDLPGSLTGQVRFMLTVEIATIYKKDGRTRKVHHVVCAPDVASAERLRRSLSRIGNLEADGRPMLGLDSRDLLEIVLGAGQGCFLIPAHIWTPWFAVLGSRSGFDSIEACYGDLADHVFALETGLSSDPPMNWRVSSLDRFRLVSFSDAHSPPRLAREATTFETPLDYFAIRCALETGEGYVGTVEFFPEEGKYHLDGHRKCSVRLEPSQTRERGARCPVCGSGVTVGVMHRVEELSDRAEPERPATGGRVTSLVPLAEVLSERTGRGPSTRTVGRLYESLIEGLGPELFVLTEAPLEDIEASSDPVVAEAIRRLRTGRVIREPGYDGEYGRIRLFEEGEITRR